MSTFVLPKEYIDFCKNNLIIDKRKHEEKEQLKKGGPYDE